MDGWVDVEDLSFAYREWGKGPLVLLLHGFPDSPGTFHVLGQSLALAGFRAVAPWLRGYGPTFSGAPTSLAQLGRDVLDLADALQLGEPVHVVGHDWGVVAGCMAATLRPERIRRLALLGLPHPAHFLTRVFADQQQLRRSWYMWFFQLPELSESVLCAEDYALIDRLWSDWSPDLTTPIPHRAEITETFDLGGAEGPIGYYRTVFSGGAKRDPDERALYGPVCVPTLSLIGANDGCVGASLAEGQEQYWEWSLTSRIVEGCGHFLHLERPRYVANSIIEFICDPQRPSALSPPVP
ncbi:alpha/beta hydrolase [Saccharopolyspora sp. NPDC049426]|uniref:alpha/beta fold hydrolase n=1 Tax=Saccharopolyspora sp. NPDC049426 TaxID=3155652 RepID=UPI0034317B79